jgi:hypothetical protein
MRPIGTEHPQKNYIPQFLKQRDINSYYLFRARDLLGAQSRTIATDRAEPSGGGQLLRYAAVFLIHAADPYLHLHHMEI